MDMRQLIESFIDVGSGFVLAILVQVLFFPFFGLYPTVLDSIGIALIFTGFSITRSWLWRLAFKKYSERQNLESKETSPKEWIRGYKEWKNNELK
jgi:hypothetical protein